MATPSISRRVSTLYILDLICAQVACKKRAISTNPSEVLYTCTQYAMRLLLEPLCSTLNPICLDQWPSPCPQCIASPFVISVHSIQVFLPVSLATIFYKCESLLEWLILVGHMCMEYIFTATVAYSLYSMDLTCSNHRSPGFLQASRFQYWVGRCQNQAICHKLCNELLRPIGGRRQNQESPVQRVFKQKQWPQTTIQLCNAKGWRVRPMKFKSDWDHGVLPATSFSKAQDRVQDILCWASLLAKSWHENALSKCCWGELSGLFEKGKSFL